MDRSIVASYGTHTTNYFVFGDFYASGTQDAEVPKSLKFHKGTLIIILFGDF